MCQENTSEHEEVIDFRLREQRLVAQGIIHQRSLWVIDFQNLEQPKASKSKRPHLVNDVFVDVLEYKIYYT